MEARLDQETFSVYCRGHRTAIRPYPISIDPSTWNGTSPGSAWTKEVAATRKRLDVGDRRIVMGVDRLDYTKGIPDRLLAFDRFLERYPEWRGRVVLVQVGSPTRDRIDRYRDLSREVGELSRDQHSPRPAGVDPIVHGASITAEGRGLCPRRTSASCRRSMTDELVARVRGCAQRQSRRVAAVEVRGWPATRHAVQVTRLRRTIRRRPPRGAVDGARRSRAADALPASTGGRPHRTRLGSGFWRRLQVADGRLIPNHCLRTTKSHRPPTKL
jgi:hypothetical protein